MKKLLSTIVLFMGGAQMLAQINYSANDTVPKFQKVFRYGTNLGYRGGKWNDKTLADIASKAGCSTLRLNLPHDFLKQWGYSIRVSEFGYYKNTLAMDDYTVFIEKPESASLESAIYCAGKASKVFKNLYTDIWDGGANGTPVNDGNDFAVYCYNLAKTYKTYVRFWEVWNEPDFTSGQNGWKPKSVGGNWYDNVPDPCELDNLQAPIYSYIRMMRIAYEVIKSEDPSAYIGVGGLGYASFLDAIMRFTDNPDQGKVAEGYSLKGGAYFDCLSYHCYPHVEGVLKSGSTYFRHSDAAAKALITKKEEFVTVLNSYGYDDSKYPKKVFVMTENNIPGSQIGEDIGGELVQKNFIMKGMVLVQKAGLLQADSYALADNKTAANANNGYDLMGLYAFVDESNPGAEVKKMSAKGLQTLTTFLKGSTYDSKRTAELQMPTSVDGAAFKTAANKYVYVLWAKTTVDRSETATASYTFPSNLSIASIKAAAWDHSVTKVFSQINSATLALTGSPTVYYDESSTVGVFDTKLYLQAELYPNPAQDWVEISLLGTTPVEVVVYNATYQKIKAVSGSGRVSLEELPKGMYWLESKSKDGAVYRNKVLKE